MQFALILGIGILLAGLAPPIHRAAKGATGWVLALFPLGVFAYFATLIPTVLGNSDQAGHPISTVIQWVPTADVNLSFYIDGLSLMMSLLVVGMGVLVFIYAGGYLHGDKNLGRFFIFLIIFMTAMLGVVTAGNIIFLFCAWELTSISSYLLIGYKHKYEDSRSAAKQALIITGGGGLALLAGLVLIGMMGGSFELAELLTMSPDTFTEHRFFVPALLCLAAGAFTKSAQVPFHFWLPGAMAAPTPVSAYLHSATMVKAGVYILARFSPIMSSHDLWFWLIAGFGTATMFTGAFLSWQNRDLKKILAYSTISVLGTLVLIIGLMDKTKYAKEAFFTFLLAHAFYKGCLFMVAGSVDHETGTRDIDKLSGLMRVMPITFVAAALAALSKAGIPFFFGFIGKELLYEGTLHADPAVAILTTLAVIANGMVGASAALVILRPFLGKKVVVPHDAHEKHVHEPPPSMWIGPVVLSLLTILFGVLPRLLDKLGDAVMSALTVGGYDEYVHLAIWHGAAMMKEGKPTPLLLSIITVALAVAVYLLRNRLVPIVRPLRGDEWGAQKWYEWSLNGITNGAEWITKFLQNGQLHWYLGIIVSFAILLIGTTYFVNRDFSQVVLPTFTGIQIHEWLIVFVMITAAIAATRFENILACVASLGVVGFGMAVLFILFQAPDLAMTQFAIETLSVVLIALVIGRLPRTQQRRIDFTAVIATLAGLLMTLLVFITLSIPKNSDLITIFARDSYQEAIGRNIVNVILVDFRGIDTMGEITVLVIAGIGVYALSRIQNQIDDDSK